MATTAELVDRRRFSNQSGTREYLVSGTTDTGTARTQLLADAPATWIEGGATLALDTNASEVYEGEGGKLFGVARYRGATGAVLEADETAFSFDTTGGTQHIVNSKSTTSYGNNPPATNQLIGITKDSVEGVDITVPVFSYQITKSFDVADVTQAYIRTLHDLTGTVNSGTFTVTTDDGFTISTNAGENLFLGASGGTRNGLMEITFRFAASPNATTSVGGISAIAKKGWEYLWVLYEDSVNQNTLIKSARAVYVEKVYPDGNHSLLGL